jgi:citrate lyase subunit beta/citryl-CoA lyase
LYYQNQLYILKHSIFNIPDLQDYYLCLSAYQYKYMSKTSTAGNHGEDVRSDCMIRISLSAKGGIRLKLESRVEKIYGDQIRSLIKDMLFFFGIKHADILLQDSGALDFVLAARMEAAIRQLTGDSREYLLPAADKKANPSGRDHKRFTRLYIPGNTPKLMLNAGIHNADCIILDLEDSVAPAKKEEARLLVRNALRTVNFFKSERMVRINQLPQGLDDLDIIIRQNVNVILIPKTETPAHVKKVADRIASANKESKVWLIPIIESALGIENAFHIASASPGIAAVAIGLEDYTADIGVTRSKSGEESLYARLRIVNACKAAGVQPLDSVFSDVADVTGLRESAARSKSLGFEGMGCIHPGQISTVRECFMPGSEETEKACRIVLAFEAAESKGLGVISLGSKMIDRPVVKRALATITLAERFGLLKKNWRQVYEKD